MAKSLQHMCIKFKDLDKGSIISVDESNTEKCLLTGNVLKSKLDLVGIDLVFLKINNICQV